METGQVGIFTNNANTYKRLVKKAGPVTMGCYSMVCLSGLASIYVSSIRPGKTASGDSRVHCQWGHRTYPP